MLTATKAPTFAELCVLEPRLTQLAAAVVNFGDAVRRKRNFCANGAWYGYGRFPRDFKRQMSALVGAYRWNKHPDPAAQELLSGHTAYDVAYQHLYKLLPNCRRCACL